jgi:hypothetical protein
MEKITYLTNCKRCGNYACESLSSNEIYDIYKKIGEINSLQVLAKDHPDYLRKFGKFYNKIKYIRSSNLLPPYSSKGSSFLKKLLCEKCKEKDRVSEQENNKLKLLLVSANLNKDELVSVGKFL